MQHFFIIFVTIDLACLIDVNASTGVERASTRSLPSPLSPASCSLSAALCKSCEMSLSVSVLRVTMFASFSQYSVKAHASGFKPHAWSLSQIPSTYLPTLFSLSYTSSSACNRTKLIFFKKL